MECKICRKTILSEAIIIPRIKDDQNPFNGSIDINKAFDIEKDYMHDYCFDFHQNKTYNNWLIVNKHNKFFAENTSLFPKHFMYNHRKCKFCDNPTDRFVVYEIIGRSHIEALVNIKFEETVNFAPNLYLPLCNHHYTEYYNEFRKETFLNTYYYSEDIIGNFDNFKETAAAEDWADEQLKEI